MDEFRRVFRGDYPIITVIEEAEDLLDASMEVRKNIRGEDVGSLG
ncbi:hypothetical protein ACRERI_01790 [Methanothermobacter thermautotrophicus]|nr:hypothetical protein [Methanothermobacter thermautotrophicus]